MKLAEEEFYDYEPIKNHIDTNAPFDGCMFETFGEELEYVLDKANSGSKNIWTITEDDNGGIIYYAGYHLVNRIGFFITKKSWSNEDDYVELDIDNEFLEN